MGWGEPHKPSPETTIKSLRAEVERLTEEREATVKFLATLIVDWVPEKDRATVLAVLAEVALS